MTYTVNELISGAYYASGVVSREFETVSGGQVSDGLKWLNDILAEKSVDMDMVPYETVYTFNAVVGQEVYFIPGCSMIDTLTFTKDNVRYSMNYEKRNEYFGKSRTNDITALPFNWYYERTFGGGKLYIYFTPDRAYPVEIHGIFRLQNVVRGQDLSLNTTVANLGIATVNGTGEIAANELVVNDIDLAGTYATPTALVTYINTGVIPNVTASLSGTQFVLTSETYPTPANIRVETAGTEDLVNNITFSNFSLTNGSYSQYFRPQGIDQFYITYLRYALADRICAEYNFDTPVNVKRQLSKYESMINKQSRPLDLRNTKTSILQPGTSVLNYGQANIGRGYTTRN